MVADLYREWKEGQHLVAFDQTKFLEYVVSVVSLVRRETQIKYVEKRRE